MIEIKLSYDPDPELALENTRFWAPLALTSEQKGGLEDPLEIQRAGDALPIEQVASRWIVASDPDDAIGKIKPYVEAGLNHLVFHAPGEDQERFLAAFEEQLMPRLRALSTSRLPERSSPMAAESRSPHEGCTEEVTSDGAQMGRSDG